jgi:hypothetical protein
MKSRGRICRFLFLVVTVALLVVSLAGATTAAARTGATTYYVDATNGNDNNSGTSPSSAWQTVFKVNSFEFSPGDSVLFKRGEVWRERLVINSSGSPNNPITFGAYGTGNKPSLLGSVERNDASDWQEDEDNIWSAVVPKDGDELLINPSFDENIEGWTLSTGGSADASLYRDAAVYDSAPAGVRINCTSNAPGDGQSWLYIFSGGISVIEKEWYVLSFKIKGSSGFDIPVINLLASTSPDEYFAVKSKPIRWFFHIDTEWKTVNVYFLANTTADDGLILIDLVNLPAGESVHLDTLSFRKCGKIPMYADTGNLIFNNEESVGIRVDFEEELDTRGEFWSDPDTGRLELYSPDNPASCYSDIECALGDPTTPIVCISDKSYVIVEDLDVRYGGGHGIRIENNANNVIIRNCDVSYIGGSLIYSPEYADFDFGPGTGFLRLGNGIEIWENAHDCTIEGCRVWEAYDEGITNQGVNPNNQYNLYYRNNLIWNCERSFQIWDLPESSTMTNIYVEGNVCLGAGFGWGHKQRPDPHGSHLGFFVSTAKGENIVVRNNVFYEAAYCAFFCDWTDASLAGLMLDNNYYYQKSGEMIDFKFDVKYTMEQFSKYQKQKGYDLHSLTGDKGVVIEAARAMTRAEDIELLNQLFSQTDALEPTKNEGVTIWGADYVPTRIGISILVGSIIGIVVIITGVIIFVRKKKRVSKQ